MMAEERQDKGALLTAEDAFPTRDSTMRHIDREQDEDGESADPAFGHMDENDVNAFNEAKSEVVRIVSGSSECKCSVSCEEDGDVVECGKEEEEEKVEEEKEEEDVKKREVNNPLQPLNEAEEEEGNAKENEKSKEKQRDNDRQRERESSRALSPTKLRERMPFTPPHSDGRRPRSPEASISPLTLSPERSLSSSPPSAFSSPISRKLPHSSVKASMTGMAMPGILSTSSTFAPPLPSVQCVICATMRTNACLCFVASLWCRDKCASCNHTAAMHITSTVTPPSSAKECSPSITPSTSVSPRNRRNRNAQSTNSTYTLSDPARPRSASLSLCAPSSSCADDETPRRPAQNASKTASTYLQSGDEMEIADSFLLQKGLDTTVESSHTPSASSGESLSAPPPLLHTSSNPTSLTTSSSVRILSGFGPRTPKLLMQRARSNEDVLTSSHSLLYSDNTVLHRRDRKLAAMFRIPGNAEDLEVSNNLLRSPQRSRDDSLQGAPPRTTEKSSSASDLSSAPAKPKSRFRFPRRGERKTDADIASFGGVGTVAVVRATSPVPTAANVALSEEDAKEMARLKAEVSRLKGQLTDTQRERQRAESKARFALQTSQQMALALESEIERHRPPLSSGAVSPYSPYAPTFSSSSSHAFNHSSASPTSPRSRRTRSAETRSRSRSSSRKRLNLQEDVAEGEKSCSKSSTMSDNGGAAGPLEKPTDEAGASVNANASMSESNIAESEEKIERKEDEKEREGSGKEREKQDLRSVKGVSRGLTQTFSFIMNKRSKPASAPPSPFQPLSPRASSTTRDDDRLESERERENENEPDKDVVKGKSSSEEGGAYASKSPSSDGNNFFAIRKRSKSRDRSSNSSSHPPFSPYLSPPSPTREEKDRESLMPSIAASPHSPHPPVVADHEFALMRALPLARSGEFSLGVYGHLEGVLDHRRWVEAVKACRDIAALYQVTSRYFESLLVGVRCCRTQVIRPFQTAIGAAGDGGLVLAFRPMVKVEKALMRLLELMNRVRERLEEKESRSNCNKDKNDGDRRESHRGERRERADGSEGDGRGGDLERRQLTNAEREQARKERRAKRALEKEKRMRLRERSNEARAIPVEDDALRKMSSSSIPDDDTPSTSKKSRNGKERDRKKRKKSKGKEKKEKKKKSRDEQQANMNVGNGKKDKKKKAKPKKLSSKSWSSKKRVKEKAKESTSPKLMDGDKGKESNEVEEDDSSSQGMVTRALISDAVSWEDIDSYARSASNISHEHSTSLSARGTGDRDKGEPAAENSSRSKAARPLQRRNGKRGGKEEKEEETVNGAACDGLAQRRLALLSCCLLESTRMLLPVLAQYTQSHCERRWILSGVLSHKRHWSTLKKLLREWLSFSAAQPRNIIPDIKSMPMSVSASPAASYNSKGASVSSSGTSGKNRPKSSKESLALSLALAANMSSSSSMDRRGGGERKEGGYDSRFGIALSRQTSPVPPLNAPLTAMAEGKESPSQPITPPSPTGSASSAATSSSNAFALLTSVVDAPLSVSSVLCCVLLRLAPLLLEESDESAEAEETPHGTAKHASNSRKRAMRSVSFAEVDASFLSLSPPSHATTTSTTIATAESSSAATPQHHRRRASSLHVTADMLEYATPLRRALMVHNTTLLLSTRRMDEMVSQCSWLLRYMRPSMQLQKQLDVPHVRPSRATLLEAPIVIFSPRSENLFERYLLLFEDVIAIGAKTNKGKDFKCRVMSPLHLLVSAEEISPALSSLLPPHLVSSLSSALPSKDRSRSSQQNTVLSSAFVLRFLPLHGGDGSDGQQTSSGRFSFGASSSKKASSQSNSSRLRSFPTTLLCLATDATARRHIVNTVSSALRALASGYLSLCGSGGAGAAQNTMSAFQCTPPPHGVVRVAYPFSIPSPPMRSSNSTSSASSSSNSFSSVNGENKDAFLAAPPPAPLLLPPHLDPSLRRMVVSDAETQRWKGVQLSIFAHPVATTSSPSHSSTSRPTSPKNSHLSPSPSPFRSTTTTAADTPILSTAALLSSLLSPHPPSLSRHVPPPSSSSPPASPTAVSDKGGGGTEESPFASFSSPRGQHNRSASASMSVTSASAPLSALLDDSYGRVRHHPLTEILTADMTADSRHETRQRRGGARDGSSACTSREKHGGDAIVAAVSAPNTARDSCDSRVSSARTVLMDMSSPSPSPPVTPLSRSPRTSRRASANCSNMSIIEDRDDSSTAEQEAVTEDMREDGMNDNAAEVLGTKEEDEKGEDEEMRKNGTIAVEMNGSIRSEMVFHTSLHAKHTVDASGLDAFDDFASIPSATMQQQEGNTNAVENGECLKMPFVEAAEEVEMEIEMGTVQAHTKRMKRNIGVSESQDLEREDSYAV